MNNPAVVLDVGNCNPDHSMIKRMLTENFHVAIDRVMFVDDAVQRMRDRQYDLVMFNRLVFDDGSEGLELVRRAKKDAAIKSAPIMMISNFDEAQAACIAEGGVKGFGKKAVGDKSTVEHLSKFLPRK
jgi:PleD family two-component response regulator